MPGFASRPSRSTLSLILLLGVLIIAVLNNGLNLLNVPPEFVGVVKGVVIVVALLLHRALR